MKSRKTVMQPLPCSRRPPWWSPPAAAAVMATSRPPPPANTAPTISAITDKSADQDTVVACRLRQSEIANPRPDSLTVTALPTARRCFRRTEWCSRGSGATRTLTLTPLEATAAAPTIAIRVTDPQGGQRHAQLPGRR